ncbi:hypothetical protein PV325_002594 [Microctonus aethiopoides]|nr:hypothetical protein PV325_002594 [Microctonus aethiopoides]
MLIPAPPSPAFPPGPMFPPQATILPQGLPVMAPRTFPAVVCFPYPLSTTAMDPWHRIHAPASCVADIGLHSSATFGIIDRPMDSPHDVDQGPHQQMLALQAANN